MKRTTIVVLLLIFYSCSPKIRSSIANNSFKILKNTEQVIVIQGDKLPENSIFIGNLKIGDSGFTTDCSYKKIIQDAKTEARKSGANIIKISELKDPAKWGSTCYRLKAKIYRNIDSVKLAPFITIYKNRNKSRLPISADYAKVYIYRPRLLIGSLIGYKVRMNNDSVVCRVRNGEKCELTITDFRKHKFWAKIDTKDSVIVDIKKGQEYFIRCSVNPGVFVGRPELNLVENHKATKEFEQMKD